MEDNANISSLLMAEPTAQTYLNLLCRNARLEAEINFLQRQLSQAQTSTHYLLKQMNSNASNIVYSRPDGTTLNQQDGLSVHKQADLLSFDDGEPKTSGSLSARVVDQASEAFRFNRSQRGAYSSDTDLSVHFNAALPWNPGTNSRTPLEPRTGSSERNHITSNHKRSTPEPTQHEKIVGAHLTSDHGPDSTVAYDPGFTIWHNDGTEIFVPRASPFSLPHHNRRDSGTIKRQSNAPPIAVHPQYSESGFQQTSRLHQLHPSPIPVEPSSLFPSLSLAAGLERPPHKPTFTYSHDVSIQALLAPQPMPSTMSVNETSSFYRTAVFSGVPDSADLAQVLRCVRGCGKVVSAMYFDTVRMKLKDGKPMGQNMVVVAFQDGKGIQMLVEKCDGKLAFENTPPSNVAGSKALVTCGSTATAETIAEGVRASEQPSITLPAGRTSVLSPRRPTTISVRMIPTPTYPIPYSTQTKIGRGLSRVLRLRMLQNPRLFLYRSQPILPDNVIQQLRCLDSSIRHPLRVSVSQAGSSPDSFSSTDRVSPQLLEQEPQNQLSAQAPLSSWQGMRDGCPTICFEIEFACMNSADAAWHAIERNSTQAASFFWGAEVSFGIDPCEIMMGA